MTSDISARLVFVDNPAALSRPDHYMLVTLNMPKALKSYKASLYSFEWLNADGSVKDPAALSPAEQEKYARIHTLLTEKKPLTRPILGIGMLENIEIGAGRPEFLIAAAHNLPEITVHIPKSNEKDFKAFLAR